MAKGKIWLIVLFCCFFSLTSSLHFLFVHRGLSAGRRDSQCYAAGGEVTGIWSRERHNIFLIYVFLVRYSHSSLCLIISFSVEYDSRFVRAGRGETRWNGIGPTWTEITPWVRLRLLFCSPCSFSSRSSSLRLSLFRGVYQWAGGAGRDQCGRQQKRGTGGNGCVFCFISLLS